MSRRRSFEERARDEVARIKAQEAAEEERRQERMAELRRVADKRREAEAVEKRRQEARLAQAEAERQRKKAERMKAEVFGSWTANGGTAEEFEAAWPQMRAEMLKQRTIEQDVRAREEMRAHTRSAF